MENQQAHGSIPKTESAREILKGVLNHEALSLPELKEFAEKFGLSLIVLFGSTSIGKRRPESDLDIGILFAQNHRKTALRVESLIASELWRIMRPRCELDVVVLNRAGSMLKRHVAVDGIPLFASSLQVWRAFRSRAFREFEDDAKFRHRRWQLTLRRIKGEFIA